MARLSRANRDACLTDLAAALGATSKIFPFTNLPVIDDDTVLADFDIAASTGLVAGKTVTAWDGPLTPPEGGRVLIGNVATPFIATGGIPVGGETIRGWVVTDAMAMVYEAAHYLEEPIAIAAIGDGFNLEPVIAYGD